MIKKINLLTFITAFVFLLGSAGKGAAFQDMVCKSLLSVGGNPTKCSTFMLDEERAEVACGGQPLENNSGSMYDCHLVVSGQNSSTPYAHTSRVWHCASADMKKYLFDQDFFMDAVRCNVVCGRCEGGWEQEHFSAKDLERFVRHRQ